MALRAVHSQEKDAEDQKEKLKNAKTTCKCCGHEHFERYDCPKCGLLYHERENEKVLEQRRKIHSLPESIRRCYEREMDELVHRAGFNINAYTQGKKQILQKYKIDTS